jgi:hypothetical protein
MGATMAFASASEAEIPVSLGFRRASALTYMKAPSRSFRCVPRPKLMAIVREAGVKVGLPTRVHSTPRSYLTGKFRLNWNRASSRDVFDYPSLVIVLSAGVNSADIRTG